MKPGDLLALLDELHRDKLALRQRHVAAARCIGHYDFNNTYQYVIAREDEHLAWLRAAIADLGGTPGTAPEPQVTPRGRGDAALQAILEEDARLASAVVEKWQDRLDNISNARDRRMCQVVLGETMEHQRFFEQAAAGNDALLGRRTGGASTGGGVLPVRWVE